MVTPEEIQEKVQDLDKRFAAVKRRKDEVVALLQNKKAELATIIREIKTAGVDPGSLDATRGSAKMDLEAMVALYERDLVATEQAFRAPVVPGEYPVDEPAPDQAIRDVLDLASVTTPAWRGAFLEHVRGVANERRRILLDLRDALERGNDQQALTFARQIVGLENREPAPP